jgi:DNA-binding MarR family transcriptional regulator
MIKVETDEYDARVKYVVPTALALKYYETLGTYLAKSQAT